MRKVNVFGIPMEVGSNEELTELARTSEQVTYYACTRVKDQPDSAVPIALAKRRLRTPCELCRTIVWYDPKSFIPFSTVVCMQCLFEKAEAEHDGSLELRASQEYLHEIARPHDQ